MAEETVKQPIEKGVMVYPGQDAIRRFLFKWPVYQWRLGLGWALPPTFALVTTVGRKSDLPRRTMLEVIPVEGRLYLASGWGEKSQWYQNALAYPYVTVQRAWGGTIHGVVERVDDPDELSSFFEHGRQSPVWATYLEAWGIEPNVDDFIAKRDRLYILRVNPTDNPTPPAQGADLAWVWLSVGLLVLIWLFGWRR